MLLEANQKNSATSESRCHALSPENFPERGIIFQPYAYGDGLLFIKPEKGGKRNRKVSVERMHSFSYLP
jgi:hypothetical protein